MSSFEKTKTKTNDLTGWLTALLLCARQLVGPLEAIHQVKVHLDCKGSKTDLTLKQGECLDIIRVQGNPEGKWLARSQDASSEWVFLVASEMTNERTARECPLPCK